MIRVRLVSSVSFFLAIRIVPVMHIKWPGQNFNQLIDQEKGFPEIFVVAVMAGLYSNQTDVP